MMQTPNSAKMKTAVAALFLALMLNLPLQSSAQAYDGLNQLESQRIKTFYSYGSEEQAQEMAARCDAVMAFYQSLIGFEPTVTLLVLSPSDWNKYTGFPVYGMPHYTDGQTLVVASEDNDFWRSFIPPLDQLPAALAEEVAATYADSNNTLTMRSFFNLLAIHELGHAFHIQGGLTMQRKWMGELFANIYLHTYVGEKEPALLPALTVFPKTVVSSTDKNGLAYRTLDELDAHYNLITQQYPNNYGWYQCRLHVASGTIYDAGGTTVFQRLWQVLKSHEKTLDNASFATLLSEEVDQSVADVPLKWDE